MSSMEKEATSDQKVPNLEAQSAVQTGIKSEPLKNLREEFENLLTKGASSFETDKDLQHLESLMKTGTWFESSQHKPVEPVEVLEQPKPVWPEKKEETEEHIKEREPKEHVQETEPKEAIKEEGKEKAKTEIAELKGTEKSNIEELAREKKEKEVIDEEKKQFASMEKERESLVDQETQWAKEKGLIEEEDVSTEDNQTSTAQKPTEETTEEPEFKKSSKKQETIAQTNQESIQPSESEEEFEDSQETINPQSELNVAGEKDVIIDMETGLNKIVERIRGKKGTDLVSELRKYSDEFKIKPPKITMSDEELIKLGINPKSELNIPGEKDLILDINSGYQDIHEKPQGPKSRIISSKLKENEPSESKPFSETSHKPTHQEPIQSEPEWNQKEKMRVNWKPVTTELGVSELIKNSELDKPNELRHILDPNLRIKPSEQEEITKISDLPVSSKKESEIKSEQKLPRVHLESTRPHIKPQEHSTSINPQSELNTIGEKDLVIDMKTGLNEYAEKNKTKRSNLKEEEAKKRFPKHDDLEKLINYLQKNKKLFTETLNEQDKKRIEHVLHVAHDLKKLCKEAVETLINDILGFCKEAKEKWSEALEEMNSAVNFDDLDLKEEDLEIEK